MANEIRWPMALEEIAASLLRNLESRGDSAKGIEVTFGRDALRELGAVGGLLRRITAVTRFCDVPVLFPEEPGFLEWAIVLRAHGQTHHGRASIPATVITGNPVRTPWTVDGG